VVGGLIACFAGYRLFRFVLGVYGFLFGAFLTTAFVGSADAWVVSLSVLIGGVVGAVVSILAYFVGVGLIGAGLAALGFNLAWRALSLGDAPPTLALVIVAVLGALGALTAARYVVIVGTALAGSWTLIVGGLALRGDGAALLVASTGSVWAMYPFDVSTERWWMLPAWLGLTLFGAIVQIASARHTKKERRRKKRKA